MHKIISVSGNSKIGMERLKGQAVLSFKSWGKHFLICFENFTVKIHLLMFATYRINERKETAPRLGLAFSKGELNFYPENMPKAKWFDYYCTYFDTYEMNGRFERVV